MSRLLAFLTATLLSFAAFAEDEPLLMRLGTLHLLFPPAWEFRPTEQGGEGAGPDGEEVIISYRVLKPGAPDEVKDDHWRRVRGFANTQMPQLAQKAGTVVRPVTEASLGEGRVLYTAVSQATRRQGPQYFVQYVIGSPRLMAYITLEGQGDGLQAAERFEKILATRRWNE